MTYAPDKIWIPIIVVISILVPLVVLYLIYIPQRYNLVGDNIQFMPLFHAILNGTTAVLITIGFIFIKRKDTKTHRFCMLTAFILSSIFLISYLISKIGSEPATYGGEGLMRFVYFFTLITHIVLAPVIIPMALLSIYWALTGKFAKHKKIVKYTYPLWLYVAVTGVLVYLFMIPFY